MRPGDLAGSYRSRSPARRPDALPPIADDAGQRCGRPPVSVEPAWVQRRMARRHLRAGHRGRRPRIFSTTGGSSPTAYSAGKRWPRWTGWPAGRGERTVVEVREAEWLRTQPNQVEGWRLVIADTGELPAIAQTVARRLQSEGATVLSLSTPALTHQAQTANAFGGDAYIGLTLARESLRIAYFSTEEFQSVGGRALAAGVPLNSSRCSRTRYRPWACSCPSFVRPGCRQSGAGWGPVPPSSPGRPPSPGPWPVRSCPGASTQKSPKPDWPTDRTAGPEPGLRFTPRLSDICAQGRPHQRRRW